NDIAHLCERQDGDTDPELVHLFDGLRRCPWTAATAARTAGKGSRPTAATSAEREPRRLMMVVDVDIAALGDRFVFDLLRKKAARRCDGANASCRKTFQKFPSLIHFRSFLIAQYCTRLTSFRSSGRIPSQTGGPLM